MKRSFLARDGILCDRFVLDGVEHEMRLPDPRPRTPEEREALLRRAAKGDSGALHGLGFARDDDAEAMEALLLGLASGGAPSMELLPYMDDPRVRPAILSAAARMNLVEQGLVGNVLQLLGIVGGEAAKTMLRSAIEGLLQHPLVWEDDEHFNGYASNLTTSCEALLTLDADATFAADAMIRMLEHPCALNRDGSVWGSAKLIRGPHRPRTEALERIRHALRPMLEAEVGVFLRAASGLLWMDGSRAVEERCKEILRNGDPNQQQSALQVLLQGPIPLPDDTLSVATEQIRQAPTLLHAFFSSKLVMRFLPLSLHEALARRGLADESPWLRHEALCFLRLLPVETAKAIIDEARADEPDPVILYSLDQLERHIS